jgi:hypothetical protein
VAAVVAGYDGDGPQSLPSGAPPLPRAAPVAAAAVAPQPSVGPETGGLGVIFGALQ